MFFKNAQLYIIESLPDLDNQGWEDALARKPYKPCLKNQAESAGFTEPMQNDSGVLTHHGDGCIMVCLAHEKKAVPSHVVKAKLKEKLKEKRAKNEKVSRSDIADMKDQVMAELLPKAFSKVDLIYAYIDTRNHILVVDAGSSSKAELLIAMMRGAMGSFDVVLPAPSSDPVNTMTYWFNNYATMTNNIEVQDKVEFRSIGGTKQVIACKAVDISKADIQQHVKTGYKVFRLGLSWNEKLEFVLHDDVTLHGLKFVNIGSDDSPSEDDPETIFDVEFDIMTHTLNDAIMDVLRALDGQVK